VNEKLAASDDNTIMRDGRDGLTVRIAGGENRGADDETIMRDAPATTRCDDAASIGVPGALQPDQFFEERYRLIRILGEGGMGQVWLAEQAEPVRRLVALKLIRAGMYDAGLAHRFHAERQSLAMMEHPYIAKVFDAGSTAQGQPYFVMEYVPGKPITTYCDEKRLRIVDRLKLFIMACEGVQHAHQKAIIHRDLKPANILIVEIDGQPVPRIIDFGVAKSAAPQAMEQTLYTAFGQMIGTPGYMSPEQVDPSALDIDTRSDVYSLGVLLYVLVTGFEPFQTGSGPRLRLDEWIRMLSEEDPPSLSAKVGAEVHCSVATAAARSTDPAQLRRLLRGDLEWIATRALERDRERRYGTPLELSADLRRYLNHEPVVAGPKSTWYQLRKFIRRNRVAAGFFVVVTLSAIVAIGAGIIAYNKRNLALREQASADRTARFMVSLFKIADPGENRGSSVTAREMLDRGAADVTREMAQEPVIRADLLTAMGQAYAGLGVYEPAKKLLQEARTDQSSQEVPVESRVRTLLASGSTLYEAGSYEEAAKYLAEAVELARISLRPADVLRSAALTGFAEVLVAQGKYQQAEQLCREALIVDRKRGSDPEATAVLAKTLDTLGSGYYYSGNLAAAEAPMREALMLHERAAGMQSVGTAEAMNNLGVLLYQDGRFAEAAAQYQQALPIYRAVYGAEHPGVAAILNNIGRSELMAGHLDESEPLLRQSLAMTEKFEGDQHEDLVAPLNSLAMIDAYRGQLDSARAEIARAEAIARLPDQGELLDQVLLNEADLELAGGNRARASALLSESKDMLEKAHPNSDANAWRYAVWDTVNAEQLAANGDAAAAEHSFIAAQAIIRQRFGTTGFYSLLAERRAQESKKALRAPRPS
jgi:non-specific serine/threonine protein kinase/serine/threonine-protein kinase